MFLVDAARFQAAFFQPGSPVMFPTRGAGSWALTDFAHRGSGPAGSWNSRNGNQASWREGDWSWSLRCCFWTIRARTQIPAPGPRISESLSELKFPAVSFTKKNARIPSPGRLISQIPIRVPSPGLLIYKFRFQALTPDLKFRLTDLLKILFELQLPAPAKCLHSMAQFSRPC